MKEHWDTIYSSKSDHEVSWYQEIPVTSLQLIEQLKSSHDDAIIDVGGGNSNFVVQLALRGFCNVTVLDISAAALAGTRSKMKDAQQVRWVVSDVLDFHSPGQYHIWHDRAVFHFLTKDHHVKRYAQKAAEQIRTGGYLIISTFSTSGPKKCSGLDIRQYSPSMLQDVFKPDFSLVNSFAEEHRTPFGTTQEFTWCVFRR